MICSFMVFPFDSLLSKDVFFSVGMLTNNLFILKNNICMFLSLRGCLICWWKCKWKKLTKTFWYLWSAIMQVANQCLSHMKLWFAKHRLALLYILWPRNAFKKGENLVFVVRWDLDSYLARGCLFCSSFKTCSYPFEMLLWCSVYSWCERGIFKLLIGLETDYFFIHVRFHFDRHASMDRNWS